MVNYLKATLKTFTLILGVTVAILLASFIVWVIAIAIGNGIAHLAVFLLPFVDTVSDVTRIVIGATTALLIIAGIITFFDVRATINTVNEEDEE